MMMEVTTIADTHFRVLNELHQLTPYARITPRTPYGWGPTRYSNPWSSPNVSFPDRQVVMVQWQNVSQGVYVCANNGNCTAPDTCVCADGWIGYDCRIPVCKQGWYEPERKHASYVGFIDLVLAPKGWSLTLSGVVVAIWRQARQSRARMNVLRDLSPCGKIPGRYWGSSKVMCTTIRTTSLTIKTLRWDGQTFTSSSLLGFVVEQQWSGSKSVSLSLVSQNDHTNEGWRRDGWWQRIPNTEWEKGLCWPRYNRTCTTLAREKDLRTNTKHPVENTDLAFSTKYAGLVFYFLVSWRRVVLTTGNKLCSGRVSYDIWTATHQGRWFEEYGECIDHVVQGCYNNGTCVAPNTVRNTGFRMVGLLDSSECVVGCPQCECAQGWEGDDCSVPICPASTRIITDAWNINSTLVGPRTEVNRHDRTEVFTPTNIQYRECPNNGNCTLPQVCTCEKGWGGPNCTVPLCAQECLNGGECVLPDLCKCEQWPAKLFIDGVDVFKNGRNIPVFQRDDGEQQNTGWTGYDCSTRTYAVSKQSNETVLTVLLHSNLCPSRTLDSQCGRSKSCYNAGGTYGAVRGLELSVTV